MIMRPEMSFLSPSDFQRVNVEGTRVVLEAGLGAGHAPRRFVYVSTDEVYGCSLHQVSGTTASVGGALVAPPPLWVELW